MLFLEKSTYLININQPNLVVLVVSVPNVVGTNYRDETDGSHRDNNRHDSGFDAFSVDVHGTIVTNTVPVIIVVSFLAGIVKVALPIVDLDSNGTLRDLLVVDVNLHYTDTTFLLGPRNLTEIVYLREYLANIFLASKKSNHLLGVLVDSCYREVVCYLSKMHLHLDLGILPLLIVDDTETNSLGLFHRSTETHLATTFNSDIPCQAVLHFLGPFEDIYLVSLDTRLTITVVAFFADEPLVAT